MKKYTRDETEHGQGYYLASDVDALLAQAVQGPTSAVRTLQRLGYTDHGGQLWKPPLGSVPAWVRSEQPVQEPKWAMPQGWWIAESTPDALNMWPTSADILLDKALAQPPLPVQPVHPVQPDHIPDAGKMVQPMQEPVGDVRGLLAARLTCWHRLTGAESDELVALFQTLPVQLVFGRAVP